jgi:hypothetical protein
VPVLKQQNINVVQNLQVAQRGEWESQSTTKFGRKPFFGWTTCFGPNAGPSSGLEEISYEETI